MTTIKRAPTGNPPRKSTLPQPGLPLTGPSTPLNGLPNQDAFHTRASTSSDLVTPSGVSAGGGNSIYRARDSAQAHAEVIFRKRHMGVYTPDDVLFLYGDDIRNAFGEKNQRKAAELFLPFLRGTGGGCFAAEHSVGRRSMFEPGDFLKATKPGPRIILGKAIPHTQDPEEVRAARFELDNICCELEGWHKLPKDAEPFINAIQSLCELRAQELGIEWKPSQ